MERQRSRNEQRSSPSRKKSRHVQSLYDTIALDLLEQGITPKYLNNEGYPDYKIEVVKNALKKAREMRKMATVIQAGERGRKNRKKFTRFTEPFGLDPWAYSRGPRSKVLNFNDQRRIVTTPHGQRFSLKRNPGNRWQTAYYTALTNHYI